MLASTPSAYLFAKDKGAEQRLYVLAAERFQRFQCTLNSRMTCENVLQKASLQAELRWCSDNRTPSEGTAERVNKY